MVSQKYRWDFIGLSTDTKPTSETSDKVVNGSTYYCSDTSKLYVYCNGTWYERKPLGGGGGTSDFNDLSNRPKYNGSDMTGSTNIPEVKTYTAGSNVAISDQNVISATDTTYSNFTGTDGTTAGAAGLVPAPATTDAGKFLKADGTWDTAGGGGGTGAVVELTTADYDYTYGGTSGVALWRLEAGLYHTANDVQAFAGSGTRDLELSLKSHLIIIDDDGNRKLIKVVGDNFASSSGGVYKGFIQYQVAASDGSGMLAQSESVISTASLMRKIGSTPTSSTVGFRGQLWYDSVNNKLYINVNAPSDYAGNWKEISLAS